MCIRNRALSLVYKLLVLAAGAAGLLLSSGLLEGSFTVSMFTYFTVLCNVFCLFFYLFACCFTAADIGRRGIKGSTLFANHIKGGVTMVMLACMIFYLLGHFLSGASTPAFLSDSFLSQLGNLLLHVVVPIMVLLDWLLFDRKGRYSASDPIIWLLIPYLYYAFVLVRAHFNIVYLDGNNYPYLFLNADQLGWAQVLINVGLMTLSFLVLGYLLYTVDAIWGSIARNRAEEKEIDAEEEAEDSAEEEEDDKSPIWEEEPQTMDEEDDSEALFANNMMAAGTPAPAVKAQSTSASIFPDYEAEAAEDKAAINVPLTETSPGFYVFGAPEDGEPAADINEFLGSVGTATPYHSIYEEIAATQPPADTIASAPAPLATDAVEEELFKDVSPVEAAPSAQPYTAAPPADFSQPAAYGQPSPAYPTRNIYNTGPVSAPATSDPYATRAFTAPSYPQHTGPIVQANTFAPYAPSLSATQAFVPISEIDGRPAAKAPVPEAPAITQPAPYAEPTYTEPYYHEPQPAPRPQFGAPRHEEFQDYTPASAPRMEPAASTYPYPSYAPIAPQNTYPPIDAAPVSAADSLSPSFSGEVIEPVPRSHYTNLPGAPAASPAVQPAPAAPSYSAYPYGNVPTMGGATYGQDFSSPSFYQPAQVQPQQPQAGAYGMPPYAPQAPATPTAPNAMPPVQPHPGTTVGTPAGTSAAYPLGRPPYTVYEPQITTKLPVQPTPQAGYPAQQPAPGEYANPFPATATFWGQHPGVEPQPPAANEPRAPIPPAPGGEDQ